MFKYENPATPAKLELKNFDSITARNAYITNKNRTFQISNIVSQNAASALLSSALTPNEKKLLRPVWVFAFELAAVLAIFTLVQMVNPLRYLFRI